MRISFTTAAEHMSMLKEEFKDLVGYSHASHQIMKTLIGMGFDVKIKDPLAKLSISMGFPLDYSFYPNQYKIGYTAWESTELKDGWEEKMMACDEIWATSTWTANVFKEKLNREDIHVYLHGIDSDWAPKKRKVSGPFRFLHIGEPQFRKNGQLVVDAFTELFGNDENYQLILKCNNINSTRIFHEDGSIAGSPDSKYNNVRIITEPLSHVNMIDLYRKCNALIYPTCGEGFGFIPLQALATGMPVASTTDWAEYKKFITVPIESTIGQSEFPMLHPGLVYNVGLESVKKSMIDIVDNYDNYCEQTFKNSFNVHKEYDWVKVTQPTEKRLKNIFKTRGL